jgi:hypothetical protein
MTSIEDHLYEWLKKSHCGKLKKYSVDRHKKIMDQVLAWLSPEPDQSFEQLKQTKEFRWLDLYFSRFEFVPLSDWSVEIEQMEIYSKLQYTPFVISISTEKRYFKYFFIKRDSVLGVYKITKHKFKFLEDESIYDITGDRYFGSYEEMRKYSINSKSESDHITCPKLKKLFEIQLQLKKEHPKISDSQIINHFHSENTTKINFTNGLLYFNLYPLRLWSKTISIMHDDFSNPSALEFDLNIRREIFIIYSLFRISNFMKIKISENILLTLFQSIPDFPEINQSFNQDLIAKNIIDLYALCDYLEDRKALIKIIDLFKDSKLDKYEKQNFYDMILVRYDQ